MVAQADKEIELEKEIARGNTQDRKMLIEESFLHANSNKPVRRVLAVFAESAETPAGFRQKQRAYSFRMLHMLTSWAPPVVLIDLVRLVCISTWTHGKNGRQLAAS